MDVRREFNRHLDQAPIAATSILNGAFADMLAKGISKNLALTVVMNDFWSEQHFNLKDAAILEKVEIELKNQVRGPFKINKAQIKKWRYSRPKTIFPELFISLE